MKKIIATGKGGVGKTTTLSNIAELMARDGRRVIVFDTDPSMNLALTFGLPYDSMATITEDKAEISHELDENGIEMSGAEILEEHSATTASGIRIVVMGAILQGGGGCLCSAISLIKLLLEYAESTGEYDIAIVDSQAGPEVLGRGMASSFDCNIILSEATRKSSEVSRQVMRLANDLGVKANILIVNKVTDPGDVAFTAQMVGISPSLAVGVRSDANVVDADREGELLMVRHPDTTAMSDIRGARSMVEGIIGW